MKYNEKGELVTDLAKNYETQENGKIWTVTLKEDISWHDGEPITAEDVAFTIRTIQNSDYKSPQRANWIGVKVTELSEKKVKFELKNPYPQFLENLTQKIIPKHIWKDVMAGNFSLSPYNLKPIGSGPYQIEKINEKEGYINSITLNRSPHYYEEPLIDQVIFKFFKNQTELKQAARNGQIKGFSNSSTDLGSFEKHSFTLPRYFAVFLNPDKSEFLQNKKLRKALNYATNKKVLVNKVLNGQGRTVNSPILSEIYDFSAPNQTYSFNTEKTETLLKEEGFEDSNNDGFLEQVEVKSDFEFTRRLQGGSEGKEVKKLQQCLSKFPEIYPEGKVTSYLGDLTKEAVIRFQEKHKEEILDPWGFTSGTGVVGETTREKLNEVCFEEKEITPLKISLVSVNQPQLEKAAELLKKQWEEVGVKTKLKSVSLTQLKSAYIKPREYEALLFGESLGLLPDFYSFWHSTQIEDPGLNLSKFESEKADKLLKEARQSMDSEKRAKKYEELQNILIKEAPCIFLYNPDYIYHLSPKIKGLNGGLIANPSNRFANIEDWYINTKRIWNK